MLLGHEGKAWVCHVERLCPCLLVWMVSCKLCKLCKCFLRWVRSDDVKLTLLECSSGMKGRHGFATLSDSALALPGIIQNRPEILSTGTMGTEYMYWGHDEGDPLLLLHRCLFSHIYVTVRVSNQGFSQIPNTFRDFVKSLFHSGIWLNP